MVITTDRNCGKYLNGVYFVRTFVTLQYSICAQHDDPSYSALHK
jgi:hypothetical protein